MCSTMQLKCAYTIKESNVEIYTINKTSALELLIEDISLQSNNFTLQLPVTETDVEKNEETNENKEEIDFPKNLNIPFNKLTSIALTNSDLKYIPYSQYFDNLFEIDISHNKFLKVPDWIINKDLKIRSLNISYNSINLLNETPKCSKYLITLDISNNCIQQLPFWLFGMSCQSLQTLNLSVNPFKKNVSYLTGRFLRKLTTLRMNNCSVHLDRVKYIHEVPNLKYLSIGNDLNNDFQNCVIELVEFIKNCKSASTIVELDISGINISYITEDIYSMKSLQKLNVSSNCLFWLPEKMKHLKSLRVLDISHNSITELPSWLSNLKALTELYASYNIIGYISKDLATIENLRVLDLYHNELREEDIQPFLNGKTKLTALDLDYNYFPCKNSEDYKDKKEKLRNIISQVRVDGVRERIVEEESESDTVSCFSDDSAPSTQEISGDFREENWDLDDSCDSDSELILPRYRYICPEYPKPHSNDVIDESYFDDAPDDRA